MDIYKLKWKMKFRLEKVGCFFKLVGYNIRHKLHLEGDDEFYYYLQRGLMRDIIHADVEEEYLAEHGLLSDPEPEEMEPEETEPGLVRELGFGFLLSTMVHLEDVSYMVAEMKEYEDRICLKAMKIEEMEPVEYQFCLPHKVGERYTDFTVDEQPLRFDGEALALMALERP